MRQLKWRRNKVGTLNAKVGHVTLFTVAYYPERGYFVASKLPGLNKTIPVNSEEAVICPRYEGHYVQLASPCSYHRAGSNYRSDLHIKGFWLCDKLRSRAWVLFSLILV